jgi:hypothetical protein
MKTRTELVVLALAGALFLFPEGSRAEQAANKIEADRTGIEGTWLVAVTQTVCETGAPMGLPFQSLLTFTGGGTMLGTTASNAFLPGQRSDDFGFWSKSGEHKYTAFEEAFIRFSGGPFTQGRQTIRHSISVTRDGFLDVASVQFYDANGAPLLKTPGCATAVGQRIDSDGKP